MTPTDALIEARRLIEAGETEDAIDRLYQDFDEAFRRGQFEAADTAIASAEPSDLGLLLSLGLASISLPATPHLPSRADFIARVEAYLADDPQREAFLDGLRR